MGPRPAAPSTSRTPVRAAGAARHRAVPKASSTRPSHASLGANAVLITRKDDASADADSVEAIERQARERTEAGLPLDGLPDLSTEGERDGFYQAQLIRELAVRHITSWTGVELEGGPAPPTPENVAAVMALYPVGERFFQEFTLRQVLLNAAKKRMYGRPPLRKGIP
jgi:hypothetical protein